MSIAPLSREKFREELIGLSAGDFGLMNPRGTERGACGGEGIRHDADWCERGPGIQSCGGFKSALTLEHHLSFACMVAGK